VTVPAVAGGPVKVIDGAFRNFAEVNEFTVGINYYLYRQMVKWQTDFSIYFMDPLSAKLKSHSGPSINFY
jgi:hypothetical protein